jgi:hypothetical protein
VNDDDRERRDVALLPDERDRRILDAVCGATHAYAYSGDGDSASLPVLSTFLLNPTLQRDLVPRLCQTGRLLLRSAMSPADQRPACPRTPALLPAAHEGTGGVGLLRTRLDETQLTYEYLDGQTRDRQGAKRYWCPLRVRCTVTITSFGPNAY